MKRPFFLRRSLGARLALVYGLVSVVVIAALGLGVYLLTERYLLDRAKDDLDALAGFYAAYTAAMASDEAALTSLAPQIATFFAPQAGYDVRLFSARTGTLLAASRDIGRLPSSTALAELHYRRPTLFLAGSEDLPDRLYVARSSPPAAGTDANQILAVVEVSRDTSDIRGLLGALRLVLVGAGGLLLVISLGASLLLARQMARPLREMESATHAIAAGDFERRLKVSRFDEIGRLAASVNQMAADLARLEAARRDFTAKISHDLRTPLTAIKGLVVNLQDTAPAELQPSLATIDEQAERLVRLVDDLLALARFQRGEMRLRKTEIDLAAVVRSAASVVEAKATRLGVTLSFDGNDAGPRLLADPDRLQQVVVNLLDNALRATRVGGQVRIGTTGDDSQVALTVVDDGCGLTTDEARQAFEPYQRGPGGGAGLGLAIAREIIEAHGGQIWLRPLESGGAEAGFWVPVSRQPAVKVP